MELELYIGSSNKNRLMTNEDLPGSWSLYIFNMYETIFLAHDLEADEVVEAFITARNKLWDELPLM